MSALPCYQFVPPDCYWSQEEGWSTFSLKSQYDRFGLPNYFWSLTNVNENFEVSCIKFRVNIGNETVFTTKIAVLQLSELLF